MIIKTNKSDLNKVLGLAFRAVPSKTSTPILENFLVVVKDKVLSVTASDMDITVVAKTPCEGEDGKACIPARTLVEIVKTLPNTEITLAESNGAVTIDWGRGNSSFRSFDVADYPEIKKPSKEKSIISRESLKTALKHAIPNISDDSLRPTMGGVFFDPKEDKINLVATDSKTLSIYPIGGSLESSFILPAKAASYIKDNLTGSGDVGIAVGENDVVFDMDDVEVYSRTIVGKFPKYEAVIPQNNGCELRGSIDYLKEVVNRISSCANKSTKFVKFTLDAMGVEVDGQDLGFNCSAHEDLDNFPYNGEHIEIGFRFDLLLNLLNTFDGNTVIMNFADSRKAVLIHCEDDPCEAIIMPVMIQ